MGILRNHLQQMKREMPEEYKRLMKGFNSEDEFIREALGFSEQAIAYNRKFHKQLMKERKSQ